ncbi:MAG TPA: YceI family protein [Luteibacter sp.]|nr:YceI family protein [Luteibacter sp.]
MNIAFLGVLATLLLLTPAAARAADFTIDPATSQAEFSVRLLWVKQISGVFHHIRGDITLDHEGSNALVDAWIDTDSLDMDSTRLRRWVMAPEFFDAEHYPQIHFVSDPTPLASLTAGGELKGQLTIRGVTKPAIFQLQPARCTVQTMHGCQLRVLGDIDRTDFGMRGRRGALSDKVYLGMVIGLSR